MEKKQGRPRFRDATSWDKKGQNKLEPFHLWYIFKVITSVAYLHNIGCTEDKKDVMSNEIGFHIWTIA